MRNCLENWKKLRMTGTALYEIEVSSTDWAVVKELVEVLEACPLDLSNDDYVDILKEIANHSNDPENSDIWIKYLDDDDAGCI